MRHIEIDRVPICVFGRVVSRSASRSSNTNTQYIPIMTKLIITGSKGRMAKPWSLARRNIESCKSSGNR